MGTREFTTERLSEENVINWKIKNFTDLQKTKSPNNEKTILQFTAGHTLKQVSIWKLELKFTSANTLELYLKLEKSYKPEKSVHARYWASIEDQNAKQIVRYSADMREYTTSNGNWGFQLVTLDKLKTSGALFNDTLTIQLRVLIYGEEAARETTPTCTQIMLKENSLNRMSNHFRKLLASGECSDFVIRVKDLDTGEYIEKKVHRNILSSQSPVFEVMMGIQMSEKENGVVTIADLSPTGLDVLLEFIYTGNIRYAWKLVPEEIVNAAEKYQVPLLKTYCDEWLHTLCTPDNVINLRNLAREHGLAKASKNISEYIKWNLDNVLNTI